MTKKATNMLMRYALMIVFNPAPVVKDPEKRAQVEHHRENTPWYVSYPDLGVTVMLHDPDNDNEPLVGYISTRMVVQQITAIYNRLSTDDDFLDQTRKANEYPEFMTERAKISPFKILVPA